MKKFSEAVVKTNEGFDPSPADIAKMLVAKHGKNVTKDHISALERDSHSGLDHDEIMRHVEKLQEETERQRIQRLRSFAFNQRRKGLGKVQFGEEQIDELKKSTLASYAKKATDDVSYHSFTAGTMSAKDPERLAQDKKAMKRQSGVIQAIDKLAKEDVELDERNMANKAKKDNVVRQVGTHAYIKHGTNAGSPKMTGRQVMSDPKFKSSKIADMYRKLPSMKEEAVDEEYQVVAHSKTGEKFKSGLYPTKAEAESKHYKLAKSGEHKKVELVKVSEGMDIKKADMGDVIKDFRDSDAPQFKGKSPEKRRKMAIAAKLQAMGKSMEENYNSSVEENDMALTQLNFIHYAAEEIIMAVKAGTDMEEWYQNKLSKLHGEMESLYSYMQGRQRHTGSLGDPMSEEDANLEEKNVPTSPEKWAQAKAQARAKFDVYPSAYANAWAAKKYKAMGGSWKVEEGKMKDIVTNKAEDERLAAHAADVLGGPVRKKEGPPGKKPLGARLAASAARRAMKSISEEEKKSKVPRVGKMEKALEEAMKTLRRVHNKSK